MLVWRSLSWFDAWLRKKIVGTYSLLLPESGNTAFWCIWKHDRLRGSGSRVRARLPIFFYFYINLLINLLAAVEAILRNGTKSTEKPCHGLWSWNKWHFATFWFIVLNTMWRWCPHCGTLAMSNFIKNTYCCTNILFTIVTYYMIVTYTRVQSVGSYPIE